MIPHRRKKGARPGRLQGEALAALRLECFERDHWHCRECGCDVFETPVRSCTFTAEMAHIQAKRRGGDNLANVRTLCKVCHTIEHRYGPSMTKPCPKKPEE